MKPEEERIFILYIIIFVIIAFVLSNFMFVEKDTATIVTTHGVEICEIHYNCGEADDVCPEDFGAECVIEDPDCKS